MTRVLFAIHPAVGHIAPTIAIAQRLQSQGHAVAYASHPEMSSTIERAGLPLIKDFHWGDLILKVREEIATQRNRWIALLKGGRGSLTRIYFHDLDRAVTSLVALFNGWRADVVVTDIMGYPGVIAAEACGLPYVTICPMVLPIRSAALPPYGFGLSPRMGPDWRWLLANLAFHWLERSGDIAVNRVRRRYGLACVRRTFFYPSPYLFIAFVTEAFEYARPDLPRQVFYVGPSISEQRGDTDVPFPWEWLNGGPLVYTSLGTINTGATKFFDRVIEASDGQPWQMVISVGRYLELERWKDVPGNVLLRNYVPQPALLRRAQAVISHGGANTVNEALGAGLPQAAAPAGADHFEAAQRLVEAGAGLRVSLRKASAADLRAAIKRLLEDRSLRQNAERIASDYAKCDGPGTSAALILRLAESKAPVLRPPGRQPTIYANEVAEIP